MNFLEVIFLGILQGVTEFFPISSSGHLLLAENFLGLDVESLKAFDVVLHGGTLLALLVLFWKTWLQVLQGFFLKAEKEGRDLFFKLVLVTLPAAVVGLSFGAWIDEFTRGEGRVTIVAGFFVLVALLLFLGENFYSFLQNARSSTPELTRGLTEKIGWKQVIWMGIFQALALFPGVSRSGSTIAAGMLTGVSRSAAARFSFLMLAPATAGAVILISKKVLAGELSLPPLELTLVGFFVSAISSFIFANLLLRFVKKHSLVWFSVYLLLASFTLFMIK